MWQTEHGMRILLIEDDAMLARGLAAGLSLGGYAVDIADTAETALRLALATPFNLGILDLGLPDRDGLDLLSDMRREGLTFPIVILSARDGLNDRIRGLDRGADDYLVKPFMLAELEARLRALSRRSEGNGEWRQIGALRFDIAGKCALFGNEQIDLTAREAALLEILISHAPKIVAKQALLEGLFPDPRHTSPNALELHVSRLRQKLKPTGVTICTVRGLGYLIKDA
jgi:DNA-binding response OmpR family regulator